MANTFLRKLGRNIGTSLTAVDSYTVGANVGAVIVGLNISNTSAAQITANVVINNGINDFYLGNRIPVAAGGAVSIAGGDQKIILQTGDSVQVNSSAASSVDVLMNIMETDGVGLTNDPAPAIGDALGGGYFAGYISTAGNGVADYMLIVAPTATGETSGKLWHTSVPSGPTSVVSVIDGPGNSATLAGLGAAYEAATWCESLTIGGFSDWYLPARNELEVAYYNLKNVSQSNDISSGNKGSNANAVPPGEPISTNYTSSVPAQTAVSAFILGGTEAFANATYWTSSGVNFGGAYAQYFATTSPGLQVSTNRMQSASVRAFRRIAI
jgi:hypothetical protein